MTDNNKFNETMLFKREDVEKNDIREILTTVYKALEEKGYKPNSQIVGYLLSGDPTYITAHNGARKLIRAVDRDKILEELLNNYIND
ncbi:IreB family regulatory phosphoprotein [Anaerococcus sp. NML200574]|uniref:IreB family regulatory phosphoprotein n=1 Tax=Anaerococcus kampingae TaxID=3115614 RepID=A0ABW9MF13_9FIRM|nr:MULTISPECIES: IreB family regulatory phosphoprotein [unclassified Anaerococcus]MCW6678051.1 IreB family regulatory phosphoprotein [Anaerococcus sp. NML200574]MCW6701189.1 IreB family regulatory phosphoprotein [Anaerococcus sp. NML200537]